MASDPAPSPTPPIGSFLSILPEARAVAPEPTRPGWLRITVDDGVVILATETIVGVERRTSGMIGVPGRTWVQRRDGTSVFCGDTDPQDVLLAMDEADGEGPGAVVHAGTWTAPRDLYQRVTARRAAMAGAASLAIATEAGPMLGLLRDHALWLAGTTTHPREWLLLLRDAAFEAAEALTADHPAAADRFFALGRQLDRDARRLPAEAPRA